VKFESHYIDELKTLYVGLGKRNRGQDALSEDTTLLQDTPSLLNVVATGDEVLDWKEMVR
jgi:hypothetical protein